MNILFLSTEIPFPMDHGHHLRTANVLKCLARDHRVHFVGFYKSAAELAYLPELHKYCESLAVFPLPEGRFRWRFFAGLLANLFSRYPFPATRYYLRPARRHIRELRRRGGIDAVHFDAPWLAFYRAEAGHLPKILTTHNVEAERLRTWMRVEKNPLAKGFLYLQYARLHRFERQVYRHFEENVVVSEADRLALQPLAPQVRFTVIPNGVDTDYFLPNFDAIQPNRLVWAGPMSDPYNKDAVNYFLQEIYPRIIAQNPQVTVKFVGSAPTGQLQAQAKTDPRLLVAGYVPDVRPHVDEGAVFIAPLRAGGGTKLKVLNAMAQGKAVVTTPVGAEGITGASGQNLCICEGAADFAGQVLALLAQPAEILRIGKNARELIRKHYDWRVIHRRIRALYNVYEPQNDTSALLKPTQ